MIRNFFIVFFRNFSKNPFYSFLNTFGLAAGFAVSIITILFIVFHLNFNTCHDDYDKIYRIHNGFTMNGQKYLRANGLIATGANVYEKVPGIKSFTRITSWFNNSLIKSGDRFFSGIDILITDSSFLDVFSYELLLGSNQDFLKHDKQVAITEATSKRIFGNKNPIGERIEFRDSTYYVGWLIKDPAINAHLQFDMLIPYHVFPESWFSFDAFTYLRFSDDPNEETRHQIATITNEVNQQHAGEFATDFEAGIMSLKDIYLHSNFNWELSETENIKNLIYFGILGLFILFIALINFANLLTAKSEDREKEVGLRKVVGAQKSSLRNQFIFEAMLISFIAFFLSLALVELFVYPVNNLLHVELSIWDQGNFLLLLVLLAIPLLSGYIAGFYPANVLSRFQPINIIKGIFNTSGNPNLLKVILVILQFSISTLLISIIIVIVAQIGFLKNKELGFETDHVVAFTRMTQPIQDKYLSLKHDLLSNPNIKNVTASHSIPGWGGSGQFIHFKGANTKTDAIKINEYKVQDDFIETFGIPLVAGRSFSYDQYRDSNAFIINEEAAKRLGDPNPIGKHVKVAMWEGEIVGIMKNFNYTSLKYQVEPLVLSRYADYFHTIVIEMNDKNQKQTIDFISKKLKEYDQNYYETYHFMNDIFDKKYKSDERILKIIIWGSIIAIILSIMGLFALTSFTIQKKYKEIGIRKVQGATVSNIIFILNKNILRWVLLTNIIAWPVGYILMKNWLQNFAYHINLSVWYFVLAGATSFIIALLTITYQSKRAAQLNPIDIIKYE